ncbi:CoB--CoM heterodisulfide reductase iron-sulfur subunit B family protein [Cetobacterium somerae]|uniref:Cysteine-rich domain protein n=1 Tax=Cetobacterium somerae ATCC BAA-474 TaxID=1319815 RepID=U7VE67_9FUSO|nr:MULTISPECIES: CoB--CoM heterodisulfide reductase iron-sulfur subunit B family protein [Cetobacterium]ERT69781.1 cysteine-rich domain protein [Cetobacterium somerae ATCC BAA-474]MBC2853233.1 CoB--CoM heterodisulfide reductase iron-sulfur subunit B family protein [Cetobacterium sp. 2G large]MCQ9625723.1 CoB--CoM heterodisulfide reductase iron-sulfur subunit B family protein [Cetobacterium somerae]WVJ01404.1 CoB--CoM heterodisulfide reductase iron-sulfur subunit B family protein [Cetobacterium 
MKYSYYPGCTLKTKATKLESYALEAAKKLNISLEEIENWQCCGGVYPQSDGEVAQKLSSVRSLISARDKEEKLLTLCSACHNVIKRVNNDIKTKENVRKKANLYLEVENEYKGETEVVHYLEMLKNDVTFDILKEKVENSLNGRRIGAYYGCLLLRPQKEMTFDNPENPTIIEDFIEALGGKAIKYPYRTECCGGYLAVNNKKLAENMSDKIIKSAELSEIEEIITACPLCKYNLEKKDSKIKVTYFTELLAEALNLKTEEE